VNVDLLTYAANRDAFSDHCTVGRDRYRFIQSDIADREAMDAVLDSERVEAVINIAAETHVDRSLLDSATFMRSNIEGTRILLEVAIRHEVKRFLQVSTDEVYGSLGPNEAPFTEQDPLQPNNPYAASKAAADLLARAYHHSFDLPVLITRCGNNYGPFQFPEKFLPLFITNALDDRSLPLYGDGQNIRDWVHVEDHTRALLRVLESGSPGEIYNISAAQEQTNQRMAESVLEILNKPRELIRRVKDRPGHDRRYALNATKIQRDLGWRPSISLDQGLEATITWYQNHRGWWESIKSGDYRNYYKQWYAERLGFSL
jgi:dTDP-glucose 4,6-dehydratase